MKNFFEIYNLLIRDKQYDLTVAKKVEFETQEKPGLVEFDYRKVMEYEDNPNEEVIGFYHTHPNNCNYMSQTDIQTMNAWITCFGRPLICAIGMIMDDIDSNVQRVYAWNCYKNNFIPMEVYGFENNHSASKYDLINEKNLSIDNNRLLFV